MSLCWHRQLWAVFPLLPTSAHIEPLYRHKWEIQGPLGRKNGKVLPMYVPRRADLRGGQLLTHCLEGTCDLTRPGQREARLCSWRARLLSMEASLVIVE